ncbi:uncharacterized protein LOC108487807 [Gossypium arboreum]|uniref:uncharacterized protein LOC108487807 n=1 Tax=Gossypium arboreum TaxID=29729 RepID=UPI0008195CBB|nr:uncharacterized protein LOC108487807 [Gossypium arboreum]
MDFVSGLPLTPTKKNSVWVIVDQLTKSTHFIPVRIDYSLQKLAKLYVSEIMRLYEVPVLIISDRDPHFTSRFWRKLYEALGSRLDFNTLLSNRVIQILEDMFQNFVIDFRSSWEEFLPLVEFAYNYSFQSSIQMLVSETEDKVRLIQDWLNMASNRQKSYSDLKRRDIEYSVEDYVFLKVSLGRRFYSLDIRYRLDLSHIVFVEEIDVRPALTFEEEPIQILDRDIKVFRGNSIPLVKIPWRNHGTKEATWKLEDLIQQ